MEFSSIRSWLFDFTDIFNILFNVVYVYEIVDIIIHIKYKNIYRKYRYYNTDK